MNFKGIFWLVLSLSLIVSIGIVSATDVNDTATDTVTQSSETDLTDINIEDNLEISQENQISSQNENSRVIYVGENKTTDGGNGSYENPYQTLKLACDNINGEDTVEINLFSGTHYLKSELIFKTNNLYITGIGGKVIVENPYDHIDVSLGFPIDHGSEANYNYTFSNIIFKTCRENWDSFKVMNGEGYGMFNNCTFTGFFMAMNPIFYYHPRSQKFFNCEFIDNTDIYINYALQKDDVLELRYCNLQSISGLFGNGYSKEAYLILDSVWFGRNSLPGYISSSIPLTRYAVFHAHEIYLGNNTYEIKGNLMWNDSTTDGIEKLNPLNFKLSSTTGDIQDNVILENGTFSVIYKSNSKTNTISIDLGSQKYILNFINNIEVIANPIFYGENQNINVKLFNKTNSTVNITVNNITYHVKVNDSNSFNFTVPNELLDGTYQVKVEFADSITHNYGFNSTNWTISKINKELYILTLADARVDDSEINIDILLEDDATGEITVFANNKNLTRQINGGEVSIDISNILVGGDNNITVVYSGNKKYTNQSKSEIIVVNRINPNMNIILPVNLTTADCINIEVQLPTNASGYLTIIINEKNITCTVNSSNRTVDVSDLIIGGNNKVSVTYSGDAWWEKQVKKDTVYVNKISSNMNITSPKEIKIVENLTVNVNMPDDATGSITISVGNTTFKNNITGNFTVFEIFGFVEGNNTINVIYSGDDKYKNDCIEFIVFVKKVAIMVNNQTITVDVPTGTIAPKFNITLPNDATGNIELTVNNKTYSKELVNGSATINVDDLTPGDYNATLTYSGDKKYDTIKTTTSFSVPKIGEYDFSVVEPSDVKVGDTKTLIVTLPNDATGKITVIIGENVFEANVNGNTTSIVISGFIDGNNTVNVDYSGDEKYENNNFEFIVHAEKVATKINNETLSVEIPTGTIAPSFTIILPNDATGNLTVVIGNETYSKELVNGSATIVVDDLTPGDYNATLTYTGDNKYDAITTFTSLSVSKVNVPLNNETLTAETPKGTTALNFSITLPSDATGNLTIIIDNKTYSKELVNGTATISIDNLTSGDYSAVVTYTGDSKYNQITSNATVYVPKPVLTAKNFSMLYTSGAKYTVTVTVDGKPVDGKTVTFTINGKKTTANTDKNGHASVKITLPPKSKAYTVSATYLGVKVTNKVTVKSIVSAKNMNVKKSAKTLKIKVTLKKVNKKYLKGKKVTLKFKGKTYTAKTNKKGQATFTIKKNVLNKLKVGKKYTYKVTYLKDSVSKKITVKR